MLPATLKYQIFAVVKRGQLRSICKAFSPFRSKVHIQKSWARGNITKTKQYILFYCVVYVSKWWAWKIDCPTKERKTVFYQHVAESRGIFHLFCSSGSKTRRKTFFGVWDNCSLVQELYCLQYANKTVLNQSQPSKFNKFILTCKQSFWLFLSPFRLQTENFGSCCSLL